MFKRRAKTNGKDGNQPPESAPQESAPVDDAYDAYDSQPFDAVSAQEQPEPDFSQYKTDVARRLHDAVNAAEGERISNRSPDLVPLTKDFEVVRKRLRIVIKAAKDYHDMSQKLTASRAKLIDDIAVLAEDSPLHDPVSKHADGYTIEEIKQKDKQDFENDRDGTGSGSNPDEAGMSANKKVMNLAKKWEDRHQRQQDMLTDGDTSSFLALSQILQAQAERHARHYAESVLDYVTEWEQVVSKRVDGELSACKKLQASRRHYTQKVEGLRNKVNDMDAKCAASNNTNVSANKNLEAMREKLERNEEKLNDAWEAHETAASRLCVLIEEVTQQGWLDLYPLLQSLMQWESHRCSSEEDVLGPQLSAVQKVLSYAYKKGKKQQAKSQDSGSSDDSGGSKGRSRSDSTDGPSDERKGLFKKFVDDK